MAENHLADYILFTFSLSNLSQPKKAKINRVLYGYKTRKVNKNKVYTSQDSGLVTELNGESVGRGALIVPTINSFKIKEVFDLNKISYKHKDIIVRGCEL